MRKLLALLAASILTITLCACSGASAVAADPVYASQPVDGSAAETTGSQDAIIAATVVPVEYDDDDLEAQATDSGGTTITLLGTSIAVEGSGATIERTIVTITSAGTYHISGQLDDGRIIVDTEDEETVTLVLEGVDIASSTSAPITVAKAEKTVITLAEGTENRVTDGPDYVFEDPETDEPNAAIFSKDDLTINGSGSLTVEGNYRDGIASKDDLKITGGTITVTAVDEGIRGRDSIAVRDGTINVSAGSDGLQSNNDEEAEKGTVSVEGGALAITAGGDGVQAETTLQVSGGDITISSGTGGSTDSGKGLKAGVSLLVTGGTIQIDSVDDSVHSNDSLTIAGGELTLASGDDAVHADTSLAISGGTVNVTRSYEGLESASIAISGGTIHVVASDDGINASDGGGGMGGPGGPGQVGDSELLISGGYVYIDANGDGFDCNGSILMSDGVVIVNGPTTDREAPIDYDSNEFAITGGYLLAVGSPGMAQAPGATSTRYSVIFTLPSAELGGTALHIGTDDGQEIVTFVPTKAYQSVVFSSAQLENGATYQVYTGGSTSGMATDGLYEAGAYSGSEPVTSFTISGMVTGQSFGGFPAGPGGDRPPRRG
jgi:hypothetical protein